MQTRYFAFVLGIIYIVIGLAGFVSGMKIAPPGGHPIAVKAEYGVLFGLFPVNIIDNYVHLVFGVWGVVAYRSFEGSRSFARISAILFAILTVCGLIPGLNTIFGILPLYGQDIWLHALSAIAAAWFGFGAPVQAPTAVTRT